MLAAVLVAGCGGGEEEGGDREAYVADGEAICSDYATAIGKLDQPVQLRDIGPYIAEALPVLGRTVERIAALDPPGELREGYDAFRTAAGRTVERAEALRAAAESSDGDEVTRLLEEAREASRDRVKLARAAGLEACARL